MSAALPRYGLAVGGFCSSAVWSAGAAFLRGKKKHVYLPVALEPCVDPARPVVKPGGELHSVKRKTI